MQNFNNVYGYPYGYNQQNQQPQMNHYAFVNGLSGAKAYQVMPNQTMLLMDSDKPIVFMKTSDNLGKATLRYFNLQEVDETEILKQYQPKPPIEYVSKQDFEVLNKRLDDLLSSIEKSKTKQNKGE